MKLKGIIPPVVTLFDDNDQIDLELNKRYLDHLIDSGIHGLLLLGSSGEFACLTLSERKSYVESMTKHVNHRVPVLVGVGHTSMKDVFEMITCAEEAGADGLLIVNPYYWRLSEEQLYNYYALIAEKTDLPIFLYNIPQYSGQLLSTELMIKLAADYENIQGVKETVSNIGHIGEVIREMEKVGRDFTIFSAFDDHLLPALMLGSAGSINSCASFAPEISVGLYEAYQRHDYEQAEQLHKQLSYLMEFYEYCPTNFTSIKEAVHQRWFSSVQANHRAPFNAIPTKLKGKMTKLLMDINLLK